MATDSRSTARELAVQFLYQCESEKLFHYSESHFTDFCANFNVDGHLVAGVRELAHGTLDRLGELDGTITRVAANWKMARMAMTDRNVLRLATYEITHTRTPHRVVINEAIELARKFGSAESAKFVNGVLDAVARATLPPASEAHAQP